jgi:DnaJ-class molecular chaperone
MEYRDYYATLGLPKDASQADIKKAFRRLAREHHPDVNKGDAAAERRFKELSEANEVLSDPAKRKAYDQLGADWAAYQRAGAGAGGDPFAGFAGFGGAGGAAGQKGGIRFEYHGNAEDLAGFSDFFRTFFAGGANVAGMDRSGGRGRGRDGGAAASSGAGTIDFEPLFGGLGGDSGAGYASSGFGTGSPRGTRRQAHRPPVDAVAETTVTLEEVLAGTERHIDVGGKRLEVKIPPGVRDGQRIRLSGRAEGGGHVYITVHVAPHPEYTREGADLGMELPLTLGEALLGGQVAVEGLGGRQLLLTVPPATQNGRLIRLAGQGLPRGADGGRGDLRVRTSVVLPAALDEEGRKLAQALVEHVDQPDPRAGARRARAGRSQSQRNP